MSTTDLLINGVRYDHSSLDIKVAGISTFGVKSIDYSDNLEPGEGYGTGAQRAFRTRGIYKAQASIEFWQYEFDVNVVPRLQQRAPGIGLLEIVFQIDIHFRTEAQITTAVTDRLVGCRIKNNAKSSASGGSEAMSTKCDLDLMYIIRNGVNPLTGMRLG